MAKIRVIVTAAVILVGWALNATSVVTGKWLLIVVALVAFAMVVVAEIARYEEIGKSVKLRDRIALISDLGDLRRPRWYSDHRVNEGGPGTLYRNVTAILYAQRRVVDLSGMRCIFEDADGRVAVMNRPIERPLEAGEAIYATFPQDFPINKDLVFSPGVCRVKWEADDAERTDLCWDAFEIGDWTPIPQSS